MCHVFIVTTLCRCDTVWRMTGCNYSARFLHQTQSHKETVSIKRKYRVESESGPALKYVFMFAQWDELFISEYWLCHPPICAASPDIWTPNIGRWVISENNKDVTMLDDDNNTNILITDSWLWWQWLHSWVSSQPLWSWTGMWPVYCDMILFVTEVSPSQWVISTSVIRCDTVHFISELEKCHAIREGHNLWHLLHAASGRTGQVSS